MPNSEQPGYSSGRVPTLAQVDPPTTLSAILKPFLVAFVVVALAIAAFAHFSKSPPIFSGEIVRVNTYQIHTVSDESAGPGKGLAGTSEVQDQLIVLAQIRVKNVSPEPLTIADIYSQLSGPDEERRSLAVGSGDFERVFKAYPKLETLKADPVLRDHAIAPGETIEGLVIFGYPLTRQQWDLRRGFTVSVTFDRGNPLNMVAP